MVAWMLSTGTTTLLGLLFASNPIAWLTTLAWLVGLATLMILRLVAARVARLCVRSERLTHNVVVIGMGLEAQRCVSLLRADDTGINVVSNITIGNEENSDTGDALDAAQLANLQQLVCAHGVTDVIISLPLHEQGLLPNLVRSLLWFPVRVFFWPPSLGIHTGVAATGTDRIGNLPLLLVGVPPLDGWRWVMKDIRDRALALLLLVFTAPVLLGIVLMIRLTSPGPVLFRQQREGYGGKMFTIFKFRTMRVSESPASSLVLTAMDDPRIFPVGALLRKTSLDELPQLLNVIRGDMWLVGPRPHSPFATAAGQRYASVVSGYMARLRVKPGITGWAQVNGWRGPTDTIEQLQQRFTYDLHYIEHLSFWFDMQVLARTAIKGFVHENAY
jgi:Undecaprenyl-phosphate glucose phosphotransferase